MGAPDPMSWFPALRNQPGSDLRLIAFPYAGGGIPAFRSWPDLLPPSFELRVAQLPGRGSRYREPRFHTMEPAIEALEQSILPLLDRPFAFFGHSLGALLAFEVTHRLRLRGLKPVHLFVSGRIAPQLTSRFPPIHHLSEDLFLEELKAFNGMSQAILDSREILEIVLPIVRSDFALLESYRYVKAEPLACPITIFGGWQDRQTNQKELSGWQEHTLHPSDLQMLPGDHFFIDSARATLVTSITSKLSKRAFPALPLNGTME